MLPPSTPAPGAGPASTGRRPRVVVLGTGCTIAGTAAGAVGRGYDAGVLPVDDLVRDLPGVADVADVESEELFRIDSVDMDLTLQLRLAERVQRLLTDERVDGVVVTHGTDTLEETAYLLHLLIASPKPVVLAGAMRPADAPGADGPANLLSAIRLAASPAARDLGTLVVIDDEIHSGRDVVKRQTSRVDAFGSAHGPLGEVVGGRPHIYRTPARRYGARSAFTLPAALAGPLPQVEVLVSHAELPGRIVAALVDAGAQGVVHAGPGAGNVPSRVAAALDAARDRGVVVVRSTRVGSGAVGRGVTVDDDAHDWVAAGDLGPWKSRILLSLALTVTRDPAAIQEIFDRH